ncbi:hypothetical protein ACX0G7_07050 [Flavitalea antarctica]
MFTLITPSEQRSNKLKVFLFTVCLSLLSIYPVYKNFYNGRAVTTYERHIALIEGRSEYFNPWQYRVLSPMLIEGIMWLYNHTIDRIYPIEQKTHFQFTQTSEPTAETSEFIKLLNTKGALKYMIVFIAFRFILNLIIFILAWKLWTHFVENKLLIVFGQIFLSLAMGNAVIASDLTFNTYLDNIFYLTAACLIVYKLNPYWLVPIVILAALNRETSMLIPFLYFISHVDFTQFNFKRMNVAKIQWPRLHVWMLTICLYVVFFGIFAGVRAYFGYQPQQVWKVESGAPMIKLNLFSPVSVKSYFEMLGVFSVIPLIILYRFKAFPLRLRVWFLGLVPIWFSVHIYSVVIYQTRLFMVPIILVIIPMWLWLVENQTSPEKLRKNVGGTI